MAVIPRLQAPTLNKYDAVTTGKGTPSSAFQRWWQSVVRSLVGTIDAINLNQSELEQVVQDLEGVVAQQQLMIDYFVDLNTWQDGVRDYILGQIGYIQCVLFKIITDTGTDITGCGDVGDLPAWPGDPPTPPAAP